jgi:hypothetical protein
VYAQKSWLVGKGGHRDCLYYFLSIIKILSYTPSYFYLRKSTPMVSRTFWKKRVVRFYNYFTTENSLMNAIRLLISASIIEDLSILEDSSKEPLHTNFLLFSAESGKNCKGSTNDNGRSKVFYYNNSGRIYSVRHKIDK